MSSPIPYPRYISDAPALLEMYLELRGELRRLRLAHANLKAAARATLKATSEGEKDALYYLRDELTSDRLETGC